MPNKSKVYLDDILQSIERIKKYTKNLSFAEFAKNTVVSDAVIRNLEIIGEAVKRLPAEIKKEYDEIEWKKIAGLRDILIHEYSGVNLEIVWDVVVNKIPMLKIAIRKMAADLK